MVPLSKSNESTQYQTSRAHVRFLFLSSFFFFETRIKQGDLTDPDYFDFISFAQYASVAMAMRNGRDIFEEKVGADGEKRTVQRDPEFLDNARLPEEHARRTGDRILVRRPLALFCRPLRPVFREYDITGFGEFTLIC